MLGIQMAHAFIQTQQGAMPPEHEHARCNGDDAHDQRGVDAVPQGQLDLGHFATDDGSGYRGHERRCDQHGGEPQKHRQHRQKRGRNPHAGRRIMRLGLWFGIARATEKQLPCIAQ